MGGFAEFDAYVRGRAHEYVDELKALIRQPTVSAQGIGVEDTATLVGEPPELSHLGEWPPEMPEMDPEPNTRSPSTDHPKASAWPAPDCWYRGPAPQA